MNSQILAELPSDQLSAVFQDPSRPIVFLAAPNFEDRSVASSEWFANQLGGRRDDVAAHVIWLQTPGVDDIFDRIKSDNRVFVEHVLADLKLRKTFTTRQDMPAQDITRAVEKTRDLGREVGGRATLILDISSLPRSIVRQLLDAFINGGSARSPDKPNIFERIICVYTAAGEYPIGADSDMIGGVEGYFTKKRLHELIDEAGILDSVVSLAGTAHDAAQTLDALWSHSQPAKTSTSAIVFLNRSNLVYSYQRLAHGTWALGNVPRQNTQLVYAFELQDVIRRIFELTESSILKHVAYRANGGEGTPTLLLGGFGPKPIGLAALLARMRYNHVLAMHRYPSASDALQITGWQYTTRYSHGIGAIRAFEVDTDRLYSFDDYPTG